MKLLKQIDGLFRAGTAAGLTDAELLERFVQRREDVAEAAFAALVDRHGALVLRVCRHVLRNEHDAEEAAQATFLVLARRAGSIRRRDSVACWLHGVALRVAGRARVAGARRRTHELRAGAIIAASHVMETDIGMVADRECWDLLHEELARLPESFRSAVVLCDLEGSTQEQAATQLRCPLGTVQSRLARGRTKLKARLEKRGLELSAFGGMGHVAQQVGSPPPAWAEATVRLALGFTRGGSAAAAGAAATANLAEEAVRSMTLGKLKLAVGMVLFAAVLAAGAATLARQVDQPAAPVLEMTAESPVSGPQQAPVPQEPDRQKPPKSHGEVKRMVRGIVRDEQGRPVAKAWIGSAIEPMLDVWALFSSPDRIRVAREPFRDAHGMIVPIGRIGDYYEYRDDDGAWQPIQPSDIRRYGPRFTFPRPVMSRADAEALKNSPADRFFVVCVAKGRRRMIAFTDYAAPARRTDAQGNFEVELAFADPRITQTQIHVASPDFRREAAHLIRVDEPDRPVEITLKPTRLVTARVLETPNDNPGDSLVWNVYSAVASSGHADHNEASAGTGAWWAGKPSYLNVDSVSPEPKRYLEINLPPGRYEIGFQTSTVERVVPIEVAPGEGPVELSDIHLETLAWVKMLGKPAAEIDAVDLDGKPVKLADYRGRVVVLDFWLTSSVKDKELTDQLVFIHNRFKNQPLTILAIHDASITSLKDYRTAVAPIIDHDFGQGEAPFRLLLDRPPTGRGTGPYGLRVGDPDSGLTADRYEVVAPVILVIDKTGRLAFALKVEPDGVKTFWNDQNGVVIENASVSKDEGAAQEKVRTDLVTDEIASAIQVQLGLRRMRTPKSQDLSFPPTTEPWWETPLPKGPLVVSGKVVGLDGKPLDGARVSPIQFVIREMEVKTAPTGAFAFTVDEVPADVSLKIEAQGVAARIFSISHKSQNGFPDRAGTGDFFIESNRVTLMPFKMGPGALVSGRVVRDGKPLPDVTMVVQHAATILVRPPDAKLIRPLEDLTSTTDERGYFRIRNVSSNLQCSIYAKPRSLPDHQTVVPRRLQSGNDGATHDLGDFDVLPGRTLGGRVIFADGKALPDGARLVVTPENSCDVTCDLDQTGGFAVKGLPAGPLYVFLKGQGGGTSTSLPGYHLSAKNKCLDPTFPDRLQGMINHDITDLTILVEPGEAPEAASLIPFGVDPARVADFEEAKAGPITGLPPQS
jgi:RNA polymerase sigma factor (sigma-70 family)